MIGRTRDVFIFVGLNYKKLCARQKTGNVLEYSLKPQTHMRKLRWDCHPNCVQVESLFLKVKASCLLKLKICFVSWHLIKAAFFSFSSHPSPPASFYYMHTQKQTCHLPFSLKKTPNPEYLYCCSPSVHLSCFYCCDPVLFCFSHFMGLHPELPLQAQYVVPF